MLSLQLLALLPALALAAAAPNPVPGSFSESSYGSSHDSGGWSGSSGSSNYGSSNYGSGYEGSGSSWDEGSGGKIIKSTTIITSHPSYTTPSYGSGSISGGDLQSCLNMCQSHFGGGTSTESPSESTGTATSSGATTTHTIIVAPTMGVLRFVPLAVTAQQGDMLEFVWGAGPHTATLSDGNSICNKSTSLTGNFDSGKLNATSTFQGSVASSNITQFHYCTVATHCQKGMFGMVNPPTSTVSNNLTELATGTFTAPEGKSTAGTGQVIGCKDNSINCWVDNWMNSGPEPMATGTAVRRACGDSGAWKWGNKWDMSTIVTEIITKEIIIENIMYSRLWLSYNPSQLVSGSRLPSDWKSPPDLRSFVALAAANTTAESTTAVTTTAALPETTTAVAVTTSANAAGANSGTTTSGALPIRSTLSAATLGLVGLLVTRIVI